MSTSLSFAKSPKAKSDTVIVFATENAKLLPAASALDKKSGGLISAALDARSSFKGKHGDAVAVILPKGTGYKQALVLGLGDPKKLDALTYENAGGKAFVSL